MTAATKTDAQGRPSFSLRMGAGLLVFLGIIVLVFLRATDELALMREYGSDPQMGIAIMFLVARLVFWLCAGGVAAGVLFFEKPHWRIIMGVILLVGWGYAILMESWKAQVERQVLAMARDSSTSPVQLEQLLQWKSIHGGYELDNRIAANPKATPEILRTLYSRHNLGTLMILARNPRTPEDILQAIVDHDLTRLNYDSENKWIRKSLKLNHNLPEAIRRKLDEQEQPAVTK